MFVSDPSCLCVFSLRVLRLLPTVWEHTSKLNWKFEKVKHEIDKLSMWLYLFTRRPTTFSFISKETFAVSAANKTSNKSVFLTHAVKEFLPVVQLISQSMLKL